MHSAARDWYLRGSAWDEHLKVCKALYAHYPIQVTQYYSNHCPHFTDELNSERWDNLPVVTLLVSEVGFESWFSGPESSNLLTVPCSLIKSYDSMTSKKPNKFERSHWASFQEVTGYVPTIQLEREGDNKASLRMTKDLRRNPKLIGFRARRGPRMHFRIEVISPKLFK